MKLLRVGPAFGAVLAALVLCASARGQAQIGYVYPAGGRAGDIFDVIIGGQNLDVRGVRVSGDGVRVAGIRYLGRFRALYRQQTQELQRRLDEIRQQRSGVAPAEAAQAPGKPAAPKPPRVTLPNNFLLGSLEDLSDADLRLVTREFLEPPDKKETTKNAIADRVLVRLMIDPDATPGDREIRVVTPAGLSNPLRFEVGSIPEYDQKELDPAAPLALPALVNGQLLPGEVDRIRFSARSGQNLVIRAEARHLIPYMADAVPGWFQAVIALYDAQGRQLACADHYLFDQDPVLFYEVPADGEYQLEVRDSIYRGREDFVYRVTIGELPFITQIFPLGAQAGAAASAEIAGWNLPARWLPLDTESGPGIRQAALPADEGGSNSVLYAVDTLPECLKIGPNDAAQTAQPVTLPIIVNGRIERSGEADVYRFAGRAGDRVVAEVQARRLGSPLDSLLRLTDGTGKSLAENDDYPDKTCGLLTDQADSWLSARLPADGTYYVHLTDAVNAGGAAYAYRLRISAPRPDFALRIVPSAINVAGWRPATVWAYAVRRDGFDGAIQVALDGAPAGLKFSGAVIPPGRDSVRMTLTALRMNTGWTSPLRVVGKAEIDGVAVTRQALPADNLMQAFAYWHLVPAQELLAMVTGYGAPAFALSKADVVQVPAGGEAQVQVNCSGDAANPENQFQLVDPPKGLSLGPTAVVKGGLKFTLKSAAAPAGESPGYADNLIVEAYRLDAAPSKTQGAAPAARRRRSFGNLPAIPFEIVAPAN